MTQRRRHDDDTTNTTRTQVQPQTPTINGNPSLRIREKNRCLLQSFHFLRVFLAVPFHPPPVLVPLVMFLQNFLCTFHFTQTSTAAMIIHLEICGLVLWGFEGVPPPTNNPFHTVDGSEIPNNHLGCIKPCK